MRISSLRRASGIGFDIVPRLRSESCAPELTRCGSATRYCRKAVKSKEDVAESQPLSRDKILYRISRAQFPYIVGAFGLRVSNRAAHAMRRCTEVCGYAGRCLPQSLRCSGQRFEKALLDDARVSCRERATTRLDVELVINKEERLLDFHNR